MDTGRGALCAGGGRLLGEVGTATMDVGVSGEEAAGRAAMADSGVCKAPMEVLVHVGGGRVAGGAHRWRSRRRGGCGTKSGI
eukprot:12925548-Prorocentrum_lima.AAC.1